MAERLERAIDAIADIQREPDRQVPRRDALAR